MLLLLRHKDTMLRIELWWGLLPRWWAVRYPLPYYSPRPIPRRRQYHAGTRPRRRRQYHSFVEPLIGRR
jgi:hypothetical protein